MAIGGCFCGKIRIEYNGQPVTTVICHCADCRKLTGAPYTYNFIVQTAGLGISGTPKGVAKKSDTGESYMNYFCPTCGTPLFGWKTNSDGDSVETTVLRAGIFDDIQILNDRKPDVEIYTDRRLTWIDPLEGADQFSGMP